MPTQTKRARQGGNPNLALTPLSDTNQIKRLTHANQF